MPPIIQLIAEMNALSNAALDIAEQSLKKSKQILNGIGGQSNE
jgi:hypothetical protein